MLNKVCYRISIVFAFSSRRAKTIWIRYVWMNIFLKTEKKISVFKNIRIRVEGTSKRCNLRDYSSRHFCVRKCQLFSVKAKEKQAAVVYYTITRMYQHYNRGVYFLKKKLIDTRYQFFLTERHAESCKDYLNFTNFWVINFAKTLKPRFLSIRCGFCFFFIKKRENL